MFPDLIHLGYSNSKAFILKGYSDSQPFTHIDKYEEIHGETGYQVVCSSWTDINRMPPKKRPERIQMLQKRFVRQMMRSNYF